MYKFPIVTRLDSSRRMYVFVGSTENILSLINNKYENAPPPITSDELTAHSTTVNAITFNHQNESMQVRERHEFPSNFRIFQTLLTLTSIHHPSLIKPIHSCIHTQKNGAVHPHTAKAFVLVLGHRPGATVLAAGETERLRGVLISPTTTIQALSGRPRR